MGRKKRIIDPRSTAEAKAERLQRVRKLTTLERPDFCRKYGFNESTFKGWENARANGLSDKGAIRVLKIAEHEGVITTFEWIMFGVGSGPRLIEKFDTNLEDSLDISTSADQNNIMEELQCFRTHNKNALDFIVLDDGMAPHFEINDYIAGPKYSGKKLEALIDKNCIIQTKDGRLLFRKLKPGSNKSAFNLICINPHTTVEEPIVYNTPIFSAAPVVWHRKKL